MLRQLLALAALVGAWLAPLAWAEELPPRPSGYILDEPDVLPSSEESALRSQLRNYEARTSNEVVVAIFSQLPEGQILEEYTAKLGRSWGLGTKQRDNGLILFLFVNERTSRLEVGYGLEGVLPDSVADRILRDQLQPAAVRGDYPGGIKAAVTRILARAEHEYEGDHDRGFGSDGTVWIIVVLFFLFAIWVHIGDTLFQRSGRFMLWQLFDLIRMLLMLFAGGGGGSRHDSDGGGGDFGGGGASGRW
jgi:uncharacterized protein